MQPLDRGYRPTLLQIDNDVALRLGAPDQHTSETPTGRGDTSRCAHAYGRTAGKPLRTTDPVFVGEASGGGDCLCRADATHNLCVRCKSRSDINKVFHLHNRRGKQKMRQWPLCVFNSQDEARANCLGERQPSYSAGSGGYDRFSLRNVIKFNRDSAPRK